MMTMTWWIVMNVMLCYHNRSLGHRYYSNQLTVQKYSINEREPIHRWWMMRSSLEMMLNFVVLSLAMNFYPTSVFNLLVDVYSETFLRF